MTQLSTVNVLGICGSLRRGSFNRLALENAITLCPADMAITLAAIDDIPLYNEDVRQQGFPEAVTRLRAEIARADALLIATPEYNYSMSGVLKNVIDWASRPPDQPFEGKPVAIMGASAGLFGTARAQYHLRQSLVYLNGFVVNRPEVFIGQAATKFDAEGNLTDATARDLIGKLLVALRDWARKLSR